jgi:hypothetical protein
MSRPIEEPTVVKAGSCTTSTHPAYGQISASRVSGGHGMLYGSDFLHRSYVAIRIKRPEPHRDLSSDWHYAGKELIEVMLSEAQWATFVSAINVGEGVPCTIDHVLGEPAPSIPHRTQDDDFKNEVRVKLKRSMATLQGLLERAQSHTSGLSKAKAADLTGPIKSVIQELQLNLPFVADCFDEHVEEKIEKAKVEMHGYMTGMMMWAGMQALTNGVELLQLSADTSGVVDGDG